MSNCSNALYTHKQPNLKFMKRAIDLSIKNVMEKNGGPFAAVIVRNNEMIGAGVNFVIKSCDPTSHAEIMAIRNTCKELKTPFLTNCDIYSSSEPCPMCYGAIRWAKIKNIYYCNTRKDAQKIGFDDNFIYEQILNNKQNMLQISNDKLNGLKGFQIWSKDTTKIEY